MKRILSFGLVAFLSIAYLMLCFPVQKFSRNAIAASVDVVTSEKDIKNKAELLSTERHGYVEGQATESQHASPVDSETKEMMPGYVITPKYDKYGQTTVSFPLSPKEWKEGQSIFMWIYIPELWFYDLKITFGTASSKASWTFAGGVLNNMASENGSRSNYYGWKLFEFLIKDADENSADLEGLNISTMTISYKSESSDLTVEEAEPVSFYHIFLGDSILYDTGIVYHQNYSMFKLKDELTSALNGIYLGDSVKFSGVFDIFEYVYVGKMDLKNFNDVNRFTWVVVIRDADSNLINLKFGQTYTFAYEGYYSVNIKLFEKKSIDTITIVNTSQSIYVDEFGAGAFSQSKYTLKAGKDYEITFKLTEGFSLTSDIVVESNNKNAATVSYYVKNDICYINVSAVKRGRADLTIRLSGTRNVEDAETINYTYSTSLKILKGEKTWEIVMIWIVFGIFCAGLLVFLAISFVKARKFDVK